MKLPEPYCGDEKYIFISYSHKDTHRVSSIINALAENGYNVWYDSGIVPGSEWDENIASHIENCGCFIAFISNNYLKSNNCKDELNFARDLEKDRLVIYLENVTLTSGVAMRINRLQSVFRYAYTSEDEFCEKLFSAECLEQCKGKTEEKEDNASDAENIEEINIVYEEKIPEQKVVTDRPTHIPDGFKGYTSGTSGKKTQKQRKIDTKAIWLLNVLLWIITSCLIPSGFAFVMIPALIGAIVFNATAIKASESRGKKISAIICIVFDVIFIGLALLFF